MVDNADRALVSCTCNVCGTQHGGRARAELARPRVKVMHFSGFHLYNVMYYIIIGFRSRFSLLFLTLQIQHYVQLLG